jgi:hypothetical protein
MPNLNLRLDYATHMELWNAKEALRKKEDRKVLPWEEFLVRAARAYVAEPENGRKKK